MTKKANQKTSEKDKPRRKQDTHIKTQYHGTIQSQQVSCSTICATTWVSGAVLAVQWYDSVGNSNARYYPIQDEITAAGRWDFATFALPVDSVLCKSQHFKVFVYNPSENPIQVKGLDVSFRPAYMKHGVKGESER